MKNPAYDLIPEGEEAHTTSPEDSHDISVKFNHCQGKKDKGLRSCSLSGDTKQGRVSKRNSNEPVFVDNHPDTYSQLVNQDAIEESVSGHERGFAPADTLRGSYWQRALQFESQRALHPQIVKFRKKWGMPDNYAFG